MKKNNLKLFKLALSKFATGLTVISINADKDFVGKTVNSFASLSLNPPLVLFSLDKKSTSLQLYKKADYIGINILSNKQKDLSEYFANNKPKWDNIKFFLTRNNIPMIKNSVANIDCEKVKMISQGDHLIFICKVNEIKINKNKEPLIYLNSKYIL
jgi:flavin reductase (DIM6/NTAB) family NADH-FMN oxidoreductase RutF